jgi:hypothetical protein
MSATRVDNLLAELTSRYDLQERFLRKVRPMVVRILSDEIPDERRTWLLEALAQTCHNDLMIRRRFDALESALKDLFHSLGEMNDRLSKLGPSPGAP